MRSAEELLARLVVLVVAIAPFAGAAAVAAAEPAPAPVGGHALDDDGDDDDDDGDRGRGRGGDDDDDDRDDPPPEPAAPAPPAPAPAAPAPAPPTPPAPIPPARTPPVAAVDLVRPGLLTPAAGRVLGGLRPTLRWRHARDGVRLYNVQVFNRRRKVLSAFPTELAYRIPPGRLAPGRRYVWRVWPYRARGGYTPGPLALSWFATPARRGPAR